MADDLPLLSTEPGSEKSRSARAQQDLALIEQALTGDTKAYDKLLKSYQSAVFNLILRIVHQSEESRDLTMEVFTKAFRFLSHYEPRFAFSTWLFRIATNHAIDFFRRKRIKTQSLSTETDLGDGGSFLLEVPDQNLNPQEAYMRQQRIAIVQQAVAQLPVKYLRLVELRYFEELSYEEVAVIMQLPLGTVKAQLHRARELLLDLLKNRQSSF